MQVWRTGTAVLPSRWGVKPLSLPSSCQKAQTVERHGLLAYLSVCMCVLGCTCVHVCVGGSEVNTKWLYNCSFYFLSQGLSLNLEHPDAAGLTGQWTPGVSFLHHPRARMPGVHTTSNLLHECWGTELGFSCLCPKQTFTRDGILRLVLNDGKYSVTL